MLVKLTMVFVALWVNYCTSFITLVLFPADAGLKIYKLYKRKIYRSTALVYRLRPDQMVRRPVGFLEILQNHSVVIFTKVLKVELKRLGGFSVA